MQVINRKYNREYTSLEKYEAGIILNGAEVKSVKAGYAKIDEAYVRVLDNEVFIINMQIPIYKFASPLNYDPARRRKLLLNKKEIIRLTTKLASGNLTIIPLSCYNKKNLIKVEIALSKGKKTWETKRVEKDQDMKRNAEKELREYKNIRNS
ncbi:MAG TPA: SsrA-binding protein SmpB [Candidatus Nitrosocosmicus sp.]|nr:SsrA-binding protein SmpB [Candidatus Nitrosocosmicus sp.]